MKTTIELPDDLVRALKLRSVHENRRLKDVVADTIRRGLAAADGPGPTISRRVSLPLVDCPPAAGDEEMDPDRVAAVLLAGEAEALG